MGRAGAAGEIVITTLGVPDGAVESIAVVSGLI